MWQLTLVMFCSILLSSNAYSKYGRSCRDIGCLPSEECTMATDSCTFLQRDGKDCGSYPTCKRVSSSSNSSPGSVFNPTPDNLRNTNGNVNRNQVFGNPNGQTPNVIHGLPIFPPPTSSNSGKQQSIYPQVPHYFPPQTPGQMIPPNTNNMYPQQPFAFGNPPPQSGPSTYYYRTTTRQPSLLDQFLYNKQGGRRRNAASSLDIQRPHVIILIGLCNAFAWVMLSFSRQNH